MNKKSAFLLVLPVLLVLAVLAGAWHSASAAVVTERSIVYGKQGIYIPGGFSPDNISLSRVHPREYRGAPVAFNRPLLNLAYHSNDGSRVNTPFAMTYVFYTLSQSETRQWARGNLRIYYKELNSGAWRGCNTVAVQNGGADEVVTTLACVAPQGTVYGLGKTRAEE